MAEQFPQDPNQTDNPGMGHQTGQTPPPPPPPTAGRPPMPPPPPPGYRPQYGGASYQPKKTRWWIPLLIVVGVLGLLFLFVAMLFTSFTESLMVEEKGEVENNSVLYLTLSGGVQEYSEDNPFADIFGDQNATSLSKIVSALEQAAEDDDIKGLYLKPKAYTGMTKSKAIHEAIETFKESGKFVYAFLETGNEMSYMMALPADKIFMPTEGLLEMNGISISSIFLRGFFEKIGVKYHVQQFEEYKSAGEAYVRDGFSSEAREQLEILITQRYDSLATTISRYRDIPVEKIKADMAKGLYTADSILAAGYIDGFMTESALRNAMAREAAGEDVDYSNLQTFRSGYDIRKIREENDGEYEEEEELNLISVSNYLKWNKADYSDVDFADDTEIAVIYGTGPISSGFQDKSPFGSDGYAIKSGSYVKYLKEARQNDKIKAIVLRIDSPGGSVIASDEIWEEIQKTRMVKPVYASMSDVAASGGYYMSMACDTIFAHPETVTGSIGVILAIPNFSGTMDKLSLTFDTISTSPSANFLSPLMELSEKDKDQLEELSRNIYTRFITRAAESRGMEVEELRKLAKGRVWTGVDAKERGLVDMLGGLDETIDYAKTAIGVEEGKSVRIRKFPKTRDSFEEFLEDIFNKKDDETKTNIKTAMADMLGMTPESFIKEWNVLPLEARKELLYTYKLLEIGATEKALYAMPQQFYFK